MHADSLTCDSPWCPELEFVLRIVVACLKHKPGQLFPTILQPGGSRSLPNVSERYSLVVLSAQRLRDAVIRTGYVPEGLAHLRKELWMHRHRSALYQISMETTSPAMAEAYPGAYEDRAA
jgi:hypothetical protein